MNQVEQLSSSCMQAKVGDIATLAGLLEHCDTLRQMAEIHQVPGVLEPATALGEHIKRMIMGESDSEEADMQLLRDAIAVLQAALARGEVADADAYPATLGVAAWTNGNGTDGHGDGNGAAYSGDSAADDAVELESSGAAGTAWDDSAPAMVDTAPLPGVGGDEGAFAADQELMGEYLAEQRGRLDEIEGHLLRLERAADNAALAELRRALHTIKGDSGFLGLSQVAQISHAAESYLEAASYPYDLENLFAVKDWLARAFEDLAARGQLSPTTQASLRHLLSRLGAEVPAQEDAAEEVATAGPPEVSEGNGTVVAIMDEPEADASSGDPAPADDAAAAEPPAATAPEVAAPEAFVSDAAPAEPVAAPAPAAREERPAFFDLTADESLLVDFISESKEHLDQASAQLLALESDPENEEAINCVFRAFHTVKGIAGFLNLEEVAELAHDTENLLDQVRRNELALSPPVIDLVFEALDWMTRLIGNVRKGLQSDGRAMTEPELDAVLERINAAQRGQIGAPAAGARTQRLGEILVESGAVDRSHLEETAQEVEQSEPPKKLGEALVEKELVTPTQVHAALKQQATQGQSHHKAVELKETLRVDYERLENMINTIGELVLAEAMISQDDQVLGIHSEMLDKKLYNLRQVSRKLQELGTTIRMVPISGTFQKMARLVRDLSRKSGKPINFISHGDETELDRAYVDLIADPLVHMIRNGVDHGIEMPAGRRQHGKPEVGTIELRAFHEGGNIHVEVRDDGQGLDVERIFAKAVEKEMAVAEDRDQLTEQEIYQMIFLPGFSTAAQVTEVSGRGVGMDVVRRNISELRGQVQIQSERDVGTTFKIILPLTLALIDGMLVRVGNERFIFPVLSVVESARPSQDMITTVVGKGEMISLRGRQLPLYRLNRLFGVPGAKDDVTDALVVVVENEGRQVGIVVDDLVGIQQTVIKNLGNGLFQTKGLSGGSIMADGTVGLIVDISGLINIARNREPVLSNAIN
ncbi:MAG TPA: Hpt domain-containing protein [bacterium]|nr:Hpt domain-containing protein [bacterium]